MKNTACRFEDHVLAAVTSGRWPDEVDPALCAHVDGCVGCSELAMVGALLKNDHQAALDEANVPSSGQVWWRAQVRARSHAQRVAARPLFVAQAIGAAAALGALGAVLSWMWPTLSTAGAWLAVSARQGEVGVSAWLAIGAWLILAPVALYLVFARE